MSDANHLMSTIRAHESRPAERDPHAGWRQRRLVAAGFDEQHATQLHRAGGCSAGSWRQRPRGPRPAGSRRRARRDPREARVLSRRQSLHDLGVQVRALRGGGEAAPPRLAGPRAAARARYLARDRLARAVARRPRRRERAARRAAARHPQLAQRSPSARCSSRSPSTACRSTSSQSASTRPAASCTRPCTMHAASCARGSPTRPRPDHRRPAGMSHDPRRRA